MMHPDLEHLIALQRLDSAVFERQRKLAEDPAQQKAFDERLALSRDALAAAKDKLTANQDARRTIEKDVAVHQGRLSKFRDQLMAVKTNVEYTAMQKEIEFAQAGVKSLEEQILERMLEADDLAADVKRAEAALNTEQKAVDDERRTWTREVETIKHDLEQLTGERTGVTGKIGPQVFTLFEKVANRRNGVAMAEARDGICTVCHVRLRPQVFNEVRRNAEIIQCDSCNRILYFVATATPATGPLAQSSPSTPSA
jgi:predicted  nucleic acid-binding Zn-ribbon protein